MKLDLTVKWYQKKIGTYDKQQWEQTVEQRILNGFVHVPLKDTKLKTDLIDVDLVRGSSFPKAKPKQSLLTVLRLAVLRLVLLPLYARFWVQQTSPKVFISFLCLYLLQMIQWAIFSFNSRRTKSISNDADQHRIHLTELLVTMALSLVLSTIHSQIVATADANAPRRAARKQKLIGHMANKVRPDRIRRKRKNTVRSRTNGASNGAVMANDGSGTVTPNHGMATDGLRKRPIASNSVKWDSPIKQIHYEAMPRGHQLAESSSVSSTLSGGEDGDLDETVRVSPGRREALNAPAQHPQHQHGAVFRVGAADDDGFESLNGKSSSGEEPHGAREMSEDTLSEDHNPVAMHADRLAQKVGPAGLRNARETSDDSDDGDCDEDHVLLSSPGGGGRHSSSGALTEGGTTSTAEWCGITTNSEECSYSSDQSDSNYDFTPTVILNSNCGATDRISCTVWDPRRDTKKAEMSVLDIASAIIERVEAMPESFDYLYLGVVFSCIIASVPTMCRICEATIESYNATDINYLDVPVLLMDKTRAEWSYGTVLDFAFGSTEWEKAVLIINLVLRLCLTILVFFLLAVAERTFKQRFLYAKLFSHLTSSRRARKSGLPHFRLKSVRNIKTWLSVRSYLKRRGPQRSVDLIISAAFILTLLLLAFLSVEWLKDSPNLHTQINIEALIWAAALGIFLLRFMTLGTKISRKYRSISILVTEQINLYLQIEQKPNKKEELMVANHVLKLAADLLKELESPFKVSGLSANPLLYTTIKVVILSALSGVLSEMLGFKLKLHKIKLK